MNDRGGQGGQGREAASKGPIKQSTSWDEIDDGWGDPTPADDYKDTEPGAKDTEPGAKHTEPGVDDGEGADTIRESDAVRPAPPEPSGGDAYKATLVDAQARAPGRADRPAARTQMGMGPVPEQDRAAKPELGVADTMPITALPAEQARPPADGPLKQTPSETRPTDELQV